MAEKISVLGLILSSSPYLRSALWGWPFNQAPLKHMTKLSLGRLARYCVHITATLDQFWKITQKDWNYPDGAVLVSPWLKESKLIRQKFVNFFYENYLIDNTRVYVKFKICQTNHFTVKQGTFWNIFSKFLNKEIPLCFFQVW